MFAVAVELLAGRYTATQFNDRAKAEWPPHPARLFSALVAAWADADEPDPAERAALRWLEAQPPPVITCGEAAERAVVTHFVPVNDPTALTRNMSGAYESVRNARQALLDAGTDDDDRGTRRARSALSRAEAKAAADMVRAGQSAGTESAAVIAGVLEVLPDNRGKQGRTYPTVVPADPAVWFAWPDAAPGEQDYRALSRLAGRVARIGHSSTLVACRVTTEAPGPTWVPGDGGSGTRLRVPLAGLADRLELAYQSHRGSQPRLMPAGMTAYRPAGTARPAPPVPLLGGDWLVLELPGRSVPSVSRALDLARAARGALLSHGGQPPAAILSGHRPGPAGAGPTPPLDGPHLAVVPLPNAGHARSDGAVLAIALILPADCPAGDREAVDQALRNWQLAGLSLTLPCSRGRGLIRLADPVIERAAGGEPSWLAADLPGRRRTVTRGYWCRPARRWVTVTPVALDRFPGNLRSSDTRIRDRAEEEAAATITRSCVHVGLPEPARVSVRLDAPLAALPAAPGGQGQGRGGRRFPGYQTGRGAPRACVHAEIEFGTDVGGPVLIGAGRYFGYGLCVPRAQEGNGHEQ